MTKLPTVKEFLGEYRIYYPDFVYSSDDCKYPLENLIKEFAIEFAKFHVQEALKDARENIVVNGYIQDFDIDYDSITNAYPLENIK